MGIGYFDATTVHFEDFNFEEYNCGGGGGGHLTGNSSLVTCQKCIAL